MNDDDPFAHIESERTLVMPSPGARRAQAAAPRPLRPEAAAALEELGPAHGLNPLVAAAMPLLSLVPELRASDDPDPPRLREALAQAVRGFEASANAAGIEAAQVIAARYVLCTLVDETAASTPWGGSGVWARLSLLVMFHNETWGGEKFFQLLAKLAEKPGANRDLLELMYLCLALGFEGRYRIIDNGQAQLDALRARLQQMLRDARGDYERELSPHWQGVDLRPNPILGLLPLWVAVSLLGIALVALYLGVNSRINSASDPVFAAIQNLRLPAADSKPRPPAAKPLLAALLDADIRAGSVDVKEFDDRSIVTIHGDGLFEPGSATLAEPVRPLLRRIGDALGGLPGSVQVTGHTDRQPIRSARFPSNWHLSQARAESVAQLLAASVSRTRLRADGKADAEPIAGNDSAAGRAQNRRVDITLFVGR